MTRQLEETSVSTEILVQGPAAGLRPPPRRVVFSWDITTGWQVETDPAKCSEIEVAFSADGPERTRVVLTHRHLARHGEGWQDMRNAVSQGWDLTRFAQVAGAS